MIEERDIGSDATMHQPSKISAPSVVPEVKLDIMRYKGLDQPVSQVTRDAMNIDGLHGRWYERVFARASGGRSIDTR